MHGKKADGWIKSSVKQDDHKLCPGVLAGTGADSCIFCFAAMAAKFRGICSRAGKKHFRPNLTYDPAFDCDRDRTSLVLWLHGPK